jgi:hypothetical protein
MQEIWDEAIDNHHFVELLSQIGETMLTQKKRCDFHHTAFQIIKHYKKLHINLGILGMCFYELSSRGYIITH